MSDSSWDLDTAPPSYWGRLKQIDRERWWLIMGILASWEKVAIETVAMRNCPFGEHDVDDTGEFVPDWLRGSDGREE